jgi:hypothetical protein
MRSMKWLLLSFVAVACVSIGCEGSKPPPVTHQDNKDKPKAVAPAPVGTDVKPPPDAKKM